ncbi:GNAT family N-acetyltransferase [Streptomyces sp. NPDC090032]|uniref:GNAT family N-acetyltransferase n=1 Tax=unclassified Streptomyces TaxID=2593676 RepID=UPI0037188519
MTPLPGLIDSRRGGFVDGFYDVGPLMGQLVVLEPLGMEHVPGLVAAAQGGRDRYALTGVPADETEAREYVARTIAGRETNSVVAFATFDRRTKRVVGSTRFCNFEHWRWQEKHRRRAAEIPDAVEIGGTWLAQDAQRTGINREAKLLMLRVAFERWAVHRVRLRTDARNERSRAPGHGRHPGRHGCVATPVSASAAEGLARAGPQS